MKEYKVLTVKTPEEAETMMNEMARQGWTVKAMTYWETTGMLRRLLVTVERDA